MQNKPILTKKRILEPHEGSRSKKEMTRLKLGKTESKNRSRIRRNTTKEDYGVQGQGTEIDGEGKIKKGPSEETTEAEEIRRRTHE